MTAVTANSETGSFWRPSAPAAPPLRVAHRLRSDRRLAATVLAAIFALNLIFAAAPHASSINLSETETDVAAQTAAAHAFVGAETPVSPMLVGPNSLYSYDGVLGCCVAPRLPGVGDDVVVIGKVDDLNATTLAPGERTLLDQLPNQGSPRANYVQNDSVLRTEMSRGVPIRDASVSPTTGELVNNTGFLRAERDILLNHGWSFDTKSAYWLPPG